MSQLGRWVLIILVVTGLSFALVGQVRAETALHTVKSGETLWSISQRYQMSLDALLQLNGLQKTTTIYPGMQLKVEVKANLNTLPATYTIQAGDTLYSIASKHNLQYQELQKHNNLPDASKIYIGMELKIPGALTIPDVASLAMSFSWPLQGTITSPFGKRGTGWHDGIDISVPEGTKVNAAAAGTVIKAGWMTGYGYVVIVRHPGGYETLYAHNSKLIVKADDTVGVGQLLALSGNTGRSTGPHLHFEISKDGKTVNPLQYLPQ